MRTGILAILGDGVYLNKNTLIQIKFGKMMYGLVKIIIIFDL